MDEDNKLVGVVVSKLEPHRGGPMRGYIAMLATRQEHRGKGIATHLVRMAIDAMIAKDADEVSHVDARIQENQVKSESKMTTRPDRTGNRSHQHGSDEALREPWIP